jgi:[protein-PII] uridylyltransferase
LKATIRSCRIEDDARRSPAASRVFLAILDDPTNLSETLTLMKDLRFLGRYIPEFRSIQALARHDYYHMYAVDEHILLALQNLERLWSGNYPSLTTLRDAFAGLQKRWRITLTVLLHDLGKAYRTEHEQWGVELAKHILERLGISGDDRERVLFLIGNHLVMSSLSQRRELSDEKVIADFARLVKDRENLAMLYLLTYADIAAVNPKAWTQWKAVLLQDLYVKTLNHLESKAQAVGELRARLAAALARVREASLEQFRLEEVDAFLSSMPDPYILYSAPRRVIDHLGMLNRLPAEELVIDYRHYPERGYTELTVCAYDAYGMFYRTAGAIASKNLNILRAQVYTSRKGVMIDTFQITDAEGNLCSYNEAWESLRLELRSVLMGRSRPPEPGTYAAARHAPGVVHPSVEFDNQSSDTFTIIDITAKDRVGLLYWVTRTLFDLNLDIGSAKIVTEGARALDSFYVSDLLRKKIVDPERLRKIQEALLAVLRPEHGGAPRL